MIIILPEVRIDFYIYKIKVHEMIKIIHALFLQTTVVQCVS